MKCKGCNKEFDASKVECSDEWDRGDGVMYGMCSYSSTPICPNCGYDNSPKLYLKESE